jgi:hypothetical protein
MDPLVIEDNGRIPFGPLPVDASAMSKLLVPPCSLYVASGAVGVPSITPAQRLRDATAPIFGNVSNDSTLLLQPCLDLCTAFAQACACSASVEETGVMRVLLRAEVTVTLNFGIPAAVKWADAFKFPPEVWERDEMSLLRHHMSLESLLYEFHEQRRDSYLSPESVRRSIGTPTCPRFPVPQRDRDRLMELATYGMVVSEPPGFHPCLSPQNFVVVT